MLSYPETFCQTRWSNAYVSLSIVVPELVGMSRTGNAVEASINCCSRAHGDDPERCLRANISKRLFPAPGDAE